MNIGFPVDIPHFWTNSFSTEPAPGRHRHRIGRGHGRPAGRGDQPRQGTRGVLPNHPFLFGMSGISGISHYKPSKTIWGTPTETPIIN